MASEAPGHSAPVCEEAEHLAQVASVLQLVLLHCPDASEHPSGVCRLLLVNKAISKAVQQSRAHCEVDAGRLPSLHEPSTLIMFAAWLPKHSGLVGKICFRESRQEMPAAEQCLALGLQLCAEQASQLAGGHLLSPTGCPYPPPLRLQSFETDFMVSPNVLGLMPLFKLRELDIDGTSPALFSDSVCQALGQISTLQALECDFITPEGDSVPAAPSFMEAVAQLEHLTRLGLGAEASAMQLLPVGLKALNLAAHEGAEELRQIDLRHLTNLTALDCCLQNEPMTALVPLQLQTIKAYGCLHLSGALPALTAYTTWRYSDGHELAPRLRLRGLQQPLSMTIEGLMAVEDLAQTAAALGSMTCLTNLYFLQVEREQPAPPHWCRSLRPLTGLQELFLAIHYDLPRSDLLHLTALTGLTHLQVDTTNLDDLGAVALADSLTGLKILRLSSKSMHTMAVLHPVSKLTGLVSLRLPALHPDMVVMADDLLHLAPLTQLTHLGVQLGDDCTDEVQTRFLAGMPTLGAINTW